MPSSEEYTATAVAQLVIKATFHQDGQCEFEVEELGKKIHYGDLLGVYSWSDLLRVLSVVRNWHLETPYITRQITQGVK